jgi:hypothetical protein
VELLDELHDRVVLDVEQDGSPRSVRVLLGRVEGGDVVGGVHVFSACGDPVGDSGRHLDLP